MKTFPRSLAAVALAAALLCGAGIAAAGAGAPAAAGKPCPGCPLAAADNAAAPPMAEGMKAHVEEMKGALAALRASEKTLAGTEDPNAFRAAVIEHLKKLDDLQASHLTHMESMTGRMPWAVPGVRHGKCPDCRCADCRCKDCGCGDCASRGDCACYCGCCKEGGRTR